MVPGPPFEYHEFSRLDLADNPYRLPPVLQKLNQSRHKGSCISTKARMMKSSTSAGDLDQHRFGIQNSTLSWFRVTVVSNPTNRLREMQRNRQRTVAYSSSNSSQAAPDISSGYSQRANMRRGKSDGLALGILSWERLWISCCRGNRSMCRKS